jgi:MoaA/NifB/PqqE/SkfB family radical SAM enzyme
LALHLPILGRCNIQCVFCSAWGRGGGFELERLKAEVDRDRTGHVQISGGDPLLKDPLELLALLRHCRLKGKIVEFQTNATKVAELSERMFRALLPLVDFFNVNFSAHTPELDYAVTRSKSGFERRCKGVDRLLAAGAKVRFTYIVHGVNYHDCEPFVAYVRERFPGVAWVQFSYVKGMGKAKGDRSVIPTYRVAAPYLNRAMARCRELGLRFEIDHIPVCFVAEFKDHHVDYRKMRDGAQGVFLTEKQKVGDCEPCALRPFCPGPRVDYIELHRSLR